MIAPAHRPPRAAGVRLPALPVGLLLVTGFVQVPLWTLLQVALSAGLLLVIAGFVQVEPRVRLRRVGP